jgi:hypothetical protein
MCNDITCKPANYAKGCKIESEKVCLVHFLIPIAGSLAFKKRNTGGRIEATPAAMRALGSVTPAAAIEITATKKALAQDPAAVFSSFIACS